MENIQFLDADWLEVFTALQEPPQFILHDAPTEGLENDAIRCLTLWNLSLHWAIKLKWQASYKIPYPRKLAKLMEPFGTVMFRYLEMCIQCHSFLRPNPYQTAAAWFWAICREAQKNTIFRSDRTSKTEALGNRRNFINSIADGINPISEQTAIHEWRLMECALSFRRGDNFDKEYLQPYIRAYRAWINASKQPDWLATIHKDGKLFAQYGRGKGKILIDFKACPIC
jgi:hypothetical protein